MRKIVTSLHNSWRSVNPTEVLESYPGMTQTQIDQAVAAKYGAYPHYDLDRVIPHDGSAPLTPEQRIRVEAIRCGAQEVWKCALPDVSTGDLVAFDWQQVDSQTGKYKTICSGALAGTVGVSGSLPAGAVLVYWGLNAGPTAQPQSPWAG